MTLLNHEQLLLATQESGLSFQIQHDSFLYQGTCQLGFTRIPASLNHAPRYISVGWRCQKWTIFHIHPGIDLSSVNSGRFRVYLSPSQRSNLSPSLPSRVAPHSDGLVHWFLCWLFGLFVTGESKFIDPCFLRISDRWTISPNRGHVKHELLVLVMASPKKFSPTRADA